MTSIVSARRHLELAVASLNVETRDIRSYDLKDPEGWLLPPFTAGAHVAVVTPFGLRNYSLCSDPADRSQYTIAIKREVEGRGGSNFLHDELKVASTVWASLPQNNFRMVETANRSLFIGGEIGITPLISMMERSISIGLPFRAIYCMRDQAHTPFRSRLTALAGSGEIIFHYDNGDVSRRFDFTEALAEYLEGTHLFCCGPAPLMSAVRDAAAHWPTGTVHFEAFIHAGASPAEGQVAFEVLLQKSGRKLMVERSETLLQALTRAGVSIAVGCEVGICGSCRVPYTSGEPTHSDQVLRPDERRSWLISCVSRGKELITLDV